MLGLRASPLIRWYLDHEHEGVFIDVYKAFQEEFFKELLTNPEGVTLPGNLGWVKVIANKSPAISKGNTLKYREGGKVDYCHNFHSDGHVFKIEWYSKVIGTTEDVIKSAFFNSDAYGFSPNSTLKRLLQEKILRGEWDHFHKKSFFRAIRTKKKPGRPKTTELEQP
jgi:hypothetical protein